MLLRCIIRKGDRMDLPEKCPVCKVVWGEAIQTDEKTIFPYLNIRTDLDYDSNGKDGRIEDQIYECSECHTLFRARWQLIAFAQLVEIAP